MLSDTNTDWIILGKWLKGDQVFQQAPQRYAYDQMYYSIENDHEIQSDQFFQLKSHSEISRDQHKTSHAQIGKAIGKYEQITVRL